MLNDSGEEDDGDDDEDSGTSVEVRKQSYDNAKKIVIEKIIQRKPGNKFNKNKPAVYEIDDDDDDENDEVSYRFRSSSKI